MTAKYDGEENTYETYVSIEGEKAYSYSYNDTDKTWSRRETTINQEENELNMFSPFVNDYAKFTYDSEGKAYKATDIEFETMGEKRAVKSATIKFVEGKMSYVEIVFKDSQDGIAIDVTIAMTYYAYGSTTITLPTVAA